MKTASTALKDFLLTNSACVHADLYTFTLANGAGVLRYASTDTPVTANGVTVRPRSALPGRRGGLASGACTSPPSMSRCTPTSAIR